MSNSQIVQNIADKVRLVLPPGPTSFSLHEPEFRGHEWDYVKECLDTGWVSSVGKYVDRFEKDLATFCEVKHAVAVVNGTAALHICLKIVDVKRDDEVLIPSLTFIATANAVSYTGAIPHFVDVSEKTLGLDPVKLGLYLKKISEIKNGECFNKITKRRIRAVVPMHTFGHPVDMDKLIEVCQEFKLALVEDAAESLGSYYKGKHTGNFGIVSALSFNGNKVITTGGGGAILTNDEKLAALAKHLTTTAKTPHKWSFSHDHIGYNYRLPNINAALGCAQLESLPAFLKNKRHLAKKYQEALSGVKGIRFFTEPEFATSNYWLNVILLDEPSLSLRDELLEAFHQTGVMARPAWCLMHELKIYKDCPQMDDLSVSKKLEMSLINLPSSPKLGGLGV